MIEEFVFCTYPFLPYPHPSFVGSPFGDLGSVYSGKRDSRAHGVICIYRELMSAKEVVNPDICRVQLQPQGVPRHNRRFGAVEELRTGY